MSTEHSLYRGSPKHKNRPSTGRKGTLCPEWTHSVAGMRLGTDLTKHRWAKTEAHRLFDESIPDPSGGTKKYATARGIAFAAHSTRDGTWHGYPIPWNDVPVEIKEHWQEQGKVDRRSLRKFSDFSEADIKWALETDND